MLEKSPLHKGPKVALSVRWPEVAHQIFLAIDKYYEENDQVRSWPQGELLADLFLRGVAADSKVPAELRDMAKRYLLQPTLKVSA